MKVALVIWCLSMKWCEAEISTKCPCGFGNSCLDFGLGTVLYDCGDKLAKDNCKTINRDKFYDQRSCNKIINHCTRTAANPCTRGRCVPTFGSFFCDCPPGWFGQKCDINDPDLESEGVKNPLYIYQQVQTGSRGVPIPLHLIFDPGPQARIMMLDETGVKVEIELFDGARYYPTRKGQFEQLDVKEICLQDIHKDPQLYDIHVCNLLPEGVHWVFKINTRIHLTDDYIPDDMWIRHKTNDGGENYVGYVVDVVISVTYLKGGKLVHTLFRNSYPNLKYFNTQVQNRCVKHVIFNGCGLIRKEKVIQMRGSTVRIKAFEAIIESCEGTRNIGTKWRLQRGVGLDGKYDPVPKDLNFGDDKSITFSPRFFSDAEHMIEAVVTVMGDPPHYGGPSIFEVTGRCFLKVEMGPMIVIPKGGNNVSVPCLFNLEIDLISLNDGMRINEMYFNIKCRQLSPDPSVIDKECLERKTEVPKIRKIETTCNSVYEYTVRVTHFISRSLTTELIVIVHFVNHHVRLTLDCVYNCFPIDNRRMLVMVATTEPYVPASIEWIVTVGNERLPHWSTETSAEAFLPLTTTRILRIEGSNLHIKDQTLTNITISASVIGTPQLRATVQTVTNVLEYEMKKFKSFPSTNKRGDKSIKFISKSELNFAYPPIQYQLIEQEDWVQSTLLLDAKYDLNVLEGIPTFKKVKICVEDAVQMRDCSFPERLTDITNNRNITIEDVLYQFEIGDDRDFLLHVAIFINKQLELVEDKTSTYLTWSTEDLNRDQLQLLRLMEKLRIRDLLDTEIRTVLFILTMTFFSTTGNEAEFLQNFEDPLLKVVSRGYGAEIPMHYFRAWMNTRISAVANLYNVIRWTYDATFGRTVLTSWETSQEIIAGIVKCWNMAFLQSVLLADLGYYLWETGAVNDVIDAQFEIVKLQNDYNLKQALSLLAKTAFRYSNLYYDVKSYGYICTRIWVVRSTYQGILQSFNYSASPTDHVMFRPILDQAWFADIRVYLPDLDKVISLNGLDLIIIIAVVSNRKHDHSISPTILIHLATFHQVFPQLPGGVEYGIKLPILIEGQQANLSSAKVYTDAIQRPSDDSQKLKFYTVYKVMLPNEFEIWKMRIFTNTNTSIKVKVNLHSLPAYDDVHNTTPLTPIYRPAIKAYTTDIAVTPEPLSPTIPRNFYIGFLLTNDTPSDIPITIKLRNTVDVCWLKDVDLKEKETTCKGKQLGGFLIECICNKFGFITARANKIRFNRIQMTPIVLIVEVSLSAVQYTIPIVVVALAIIMVTVAVVMDIRRRKQVVLIPMEDVRPSDRHPLIVGVFTSPNLMAGTISTVAIKIEGRSSSSRVHLLKTKSRRVLKRADDDWFVLATNQPLGKIHNILLWHNYHCLSDWYCRYVLIYDIRQDYWYIANVNRWFRLHPNVDDCRFAEVRTYKFGNMELGLKAMPHKLEDHILGEIHNSHFFISMFMVHLRSMYSYENRTLAFLIKLISVFFGSWIIQEIHLFHHRHLDISEPALEDLHFDIDSIKIIVIIDVLSYIFVVPYMLLVRSSFMSGLIQRKTTNPLNVDVIRKEQASVTATGDKKLSRKSTKISGKSMASKQSTNTKSVIFSIQKSTDTTEMEQSWISQEQPKPQNRTVTYIQHSRTWKLLTLLFGPSQFRCINVDNLIFDIKTFRRILYSRIFAGLYLVCGLATIVYIMQFTNIGAKYAVTLFYVILVVTIDICILNPIINLLQTIVMFQVLQMSNREFNFWSESSKVDLPQPLSLWEYSQTVTKPEYRPLLSSEVEKLMKKSTLYSYVRTCVLYSYVILCLILTASVLKSRYDTSYYLFDRVVHAAAEHEKITYDIRTGDIRSSILGVNRPRKVGEFIQSTFAELMYTWPNHEIMDPLNNDRRFLDRVSKIKGPASVLITRISKKKRKKVPIYFTNLYDKAFGFLSESVIDKSPIILAGRELNYTRMSPRTLLRGRSGTNYGMDGNQAIITSFPYWHSYYTSLVNMIEDLNKKEDALLRLIIISFNVITCNTHRLSAVDVIFEFLPSGECSANLHIASIKVRNPSDEYSAIILRTSIVLLALFHIAFAAIDISTLGFNNYITHWYGRTKVALSVSGLIVCLTTLTCYFSQNLVLDMFFKLPSDKYMDLHKLHYNHGLDSLALSFFLLVMCTDLAVAIKNGLNLKIIAAISSQGAHLLLSMYLIIMIYSRAAASSANVLANDFEFMVLFFNKGMFPLEGRDGENQFFVIVAIVIICVFSKFCVAVFIYNLEASDWDFVSEYHPGRPVADRSKIRPLRSTREVKMRYLKKHSVKSTVSVVSSKSDHEHPQTKKSITSQKSEQSRETITSLKKDGKRDTISSKKKESRVRIQTSKQEESHENQISSEEKKSKSSVPETEDGTKKLEARTSKLSQKFAHWFE